MSFWKSIAGTVRIRITSASVTRILEQANDAGVVLEHTVWADDLSVDVTIQRQNFICLRDIVRRTGDKIEVLERTGLYWYISKLRERPVFLLSLALYMTLVMFLPTRIFFVTVSGNDIISTEMILTQAEAVGVRFGAYKKDLRSEKVKNALLSSIPELQWAGVNTRGCVAEISVRERSYGPDIIDDSGVRSIIAKCDGLVQEVTVTKGNVLCKVGDVVKKGQVLISGYTDCGIQIKATAADGEIYAQTVHTIRAVSPLIRQWRRKEVDADKKYSIIFGKKLINLYNGSGISGTSCVKIYEKKYITLPGGFQLPLGMAIETQIYYVTETERLPEAQAELLAIGQTRNYLCDNMVAGQILSERLTTELDGDALLLTGRYNCREMIGQIYFEEIIHGNEQGDRTDH